MKAIPCTLGIARGSLFYIYLLELLPENKRSKYNCIIMICEGFMGVVNTALVYFIGDARKVLLIIFAISVFHFIFLIATPESPKFLHSVHKFKEMNESLKYIASINGTYLPETEKIEEVIITNSSDNLTVSFFQALKDSIYRNNLFIMALNWCVCSLSFYIIGYYVGKFPGNLFINAFAMAAADTISSSISSIFVSKLGFRFGFTFVYLLVITATTVYSFAKNTQQIEYGCVFIMRLGTCLCFVLCYFGNSEYFDTKVKARSFAFCNLKVPSKIARE